MARRFRRPADNKKGRNMSTPSMRTPQMDRAMSRLRDDLDDVHDHLRREYDDRTLTLPVLLKALELVDARLDSQGD